LITYYQIFEKSINKQISFNKIIRKVAKTQGFHLELGQNLWSNQKARVSQKQRKKI
jgi:hypothetical protein